ncbi:FUSC family protein [Amycolatopsis sp. FDAARGOS 1241]|uniref:FUSC family protein n=1 Tax=Amycolatopsis sp. FDAARGOS 1241 TaxID=2778070 RepID=UPI001950B013|nr:FUSC family protein [Amycolatopsis sp. FDAARGOS 1241]QRP45612.1 FUSC family protein [Amycolatopsis sp. FDAARGOS 1241]
MLVRAGAGLSTVEAKVGEAIMASASTRPVHRRTRAGPLSKVFALDPAGINWPRAVLFVDVALVPLVVFWAIGDEEYLLSALFGALFAALSDPGGGYGNRAARIAVFVLIGAALTALGFGLGGSGWGWVALAAFAVTLAASLTLTFGVHRFVASLLLDIWFIIAVGAAFALHQADITSHTWLQVLAWAGGAALWIAVTFIGWLIHGRRDRPQVVAELPGDTSRHGLTRPLIMFAVIRAVVIGGTVAIAFGLELSHGYWMPIAAIVAMKPSLAQGTLVAAQRLAGALLGAAAAAVVLLIPASEHGPELAAVSRGLEVVALIILMHGCAIRFWNYALYCAAIATGVLILVDLPQPSDYSAEGYRVLWTLCGAGIAVLVMFLAGLLARRSAPHPATPQQPAAPPP